MAKTENCFNCVYSYWDRGQVPSSLSGGFPLRPSCANHPDSPGQMRTLSSGRVCRNYRSRTAAPQGDVKQIPVGEGLVAYVDAADFEWLNQWTWYLLGGYAARRSQRKTIYMHREITRAPAGMVVDHVNHNKLDDTRANLRVCTHRENVYNSSKKRGTASRFRGVYWRKDGNKWRAKIKFEGRPIYFGTFAEEIDAARAHDRAAVEYFGDAARLNFPEEWPPERRAAVARQRTEDRGRKTEDARRKAKSSRATDHGSRATAPKKSARATGHGSRATKKATARAETPGRRGNRQS